jgi:hypothetical protein
MIPGKLSTKKMIPGKAKSLNWFLKYFLFGNIIK